MIKQLLTSSKKAFFSCFFLNSLLVLSATSFAQTNTSFGTDALAQSGTEKYVISGISITSPGSYSRPTVNLNVAGTVEWIYQFMDVSEPGGVYFEGEFRSTTDLGSFSPSFVGGSGTGATLYIDYGYEDGGYYYYYIYSMDGGSGYAPTITLSPVTYSSFDLYTYLHESNQLEIIYYDYLDKNLYTSPPVVSVSFGGAVAEAVLSGTPANGNNTAVGFQSQMNTVSSENTSLGTYSLKTNTSGKGNLALGNEALFSNTTGSRNLASGYRAMYSNTTGYDNLAGGYHSLYSNTTGDYNIAFGRNALYKNSTGEFNLAAGYNSLYSNTTGNYNIAFGGNALNQNSTGGYNLAAGYYSLNANTTGSHNIALGYQSLYFSTTASNNIGLGYQALFSNTTGGNNVAIGIYSLINNKTGSNNIALGANALRSNISGNYNIANGDGALYANTLGVNNVAYGYAALRHSNIANNNVALGVHAGHVVSSGSNNVFVGANAGKGIASGNNNTIIGANITGLPSNLSNTVIISDGEGNQRFYSPANGNIIVGWGNHPSDDGFKLDVGGTGRFADVLTLAAEPVTSAGAYNVLTRNNVTGAIEKMNVSFTNLVNTIDNQNISGNKFFTGSIGIGTTAPNSKLHVNSTNGNWIAGNFGEASGGDRVVLGRLNNVATIGGHNNALNTWAPLALNSEGGNVLIATTINNTVDQLQVNGSIKAKAVKVDPNAWPDYVFEPAYQLRSLEQTAQFIKVNKHLPEIPSAKEVIENGVELGALGASLLKKIEELTLYLIEKDKQLQEANERIDQLSKKVENLILKP